jgi:hypothetical protein
MARGAVEVLSELRVSDALVRDAFDWQTNDGGTRWHHRTTHRLGRSGQPAGVPRCFMTSADVAGDRITAGTRRE